jgi:hypothetical protein
MESQTLTIIDWMTAGIAAYAAIVATGALALEVRRWFQSGARLHIDLMSGAEMFGVPGTEGNKYLVATVSNRGNSPTTITHFVLNDFKGWLNYLRSKPNFVGLVANPQIHVQAKSIPKLLQPGEQWSGMAIIDDDLNHRIDGGYLHVVIYANHTDEPIRKRVHKPAKPPQDAKSV